MIHTKPRRQPHGALQSNVQPALMWRDAPVLVLLKERRESQLTVSAQQWLSEVQKLGVAGRLRTAALCPTLIRPEPAPHSLVIRQEECAAKKIAQMEREWKGVQQHARYPQHLQWIARTASFPSSTSAR
jgi:hypothetical protein